MPLGFADLHEVPLAKLKTAVDDWSTMAKDLKTLARDARDGMQTKSDKARWAGVNADVTRPFVAKTAKEFSDAAKAAEGVHGVLSEAYTHFKKCQDDLKKIVEHEAPARKVTVAADGTVRATHPVSESLGQNARHDPDYQDLVRQEHSDIAYIEGRIKKVLDEADQADQDIAKALRIDLGDDPNDFSAPKYENTAEMHAARAADLAAKGDKMTDKELKELDGLLHEYRNSPDFTTRFYKDLGPKKSVEFYADLTIHTDGDSKARTDSLQALQKDLGFALATATDPDNPVHLSEKWQTQLRGVGADVINFRYDNGSPGTIYGYQALSNILRYGHYDRRFLTPIAEHAVQLQQDYADIYKPGEYAEPLVNLNPAGGDGSAGTNPITGIMEGLGHSPEAAKDFFDGKMTPYDLDGQKMDKAYFERERFGGYDDQVLKDFNLVEGSDGNLYLKNLHVLDGKSSKDYFDLLTDKDYPWFDDHKGFAPGPGADGDAQDAWEKAAEKGKASGPNALGHALEAAVSGRSYDDTSSTSLKHDATQAHLMHRVVEKFGTSPGNDLIALKSDGKSGPFASMNDSLGNMTGEYMRDMQKAMLGGSSSIATNGADADLSSLNDGPLLKFVGTVAHDPHAYGAIVNAQQATTTDLFTGVAHDYGQGGHHDMTAAHQQIDKLARPGATIAGIASAARAESVYIEKTGGDKAFNDGLSTGAKWANRGFGLISKPLEATGVGAPVGWAVEDIQESVVKHYTHDSAGEGKDAAYAYMEKQREATAEAMRDSARTAAKDAGLPSGAQGDFADTGYQSSNTGYDEGANRKAGYSFS
ncbi:hypothetical protein [Streptomyces sp. NPDC093060]|uniref:hypothetical protein n=1 Tax=Streptomyces sp. NPDC093060 TaxID=3366019 RepID=UPI0038208239